MVPVEPHKADLSPSLNRVNDPFYRRSSGWLDAGIKWSLVLYYIGVLNEREIKDDFLQAEERSYEALEPVNHHVEKTEDDLLQKSHQRMRNLNEILFTVTTFKPAAGLLVLYQCI